ncbi:gluconokinase [Candidatus Enterococcus mansonii]|uniref:Gluconate kinase n=1 Tax=Candidatus Enterococcus mansonii TaxID=1834181 RepID=A0A242CBV6_9ENTE|nr:gluconokinase [Enterococcus sp. 4G2_DIV0659]OTO07744.1 gluconate kinase [Enterococcus sp. 4G2_DIV0659]
MEKIAIGVDMGTTQTKAVAFNQDGTVRTSAYVRYPLIQETEGMAEQEVNQIFQAVLTCIKQVVFEVHPLEVSLVSFSTAMHGLIVMDKKNQPLTQVITWADNRAEKYAEELKDTAVGQTLYQNTGLPMHPMTPFHKIRWIKEELPAIYNQAVMFIGMKEYVFYQLFDQYITDISTASGTGFLNIHDLTWDQQALSEMGINAEQLPKLVKPTHQLIGLKNEWIEVLGLSAKTIFVLGGADGPLSNLGLGALAKGTATLTVGTSGALRYIVEKPSTHPQAETFCCVLDEKHWVIGGATSNGAGIFDWACETLLKEVQDVARMSGKNPYDEVMKLVDETPVGAKGLLFHPYLLGERAPLWDAKATGSFVGLKRTHDNKLMMRAVIEGICLNLKRILTELEDLGGPINEIRATGGFADSEVFKKVMADVLGYNLSLTQSIEASALGAVLLGWQSLGEMADLEAACKQVKVYEIIKPNNKNHRVYQQMYPLFVVTQQQMCASYHQLAKLRADLG